MKTYLNLMFIIFLCLSVISCVNKEIPRTPVFEDYEANPTLNQAGLSLDKVVEELPKKTTIIRSESINTKLQTGIIQTKLSEQDKAKVLEQIININKSQDLIFKTGVEIEATQKELIATQGYLKQAKTQITKMEEVFKASLEAKDQSDKKLQEALDREKGAIRQIIYWSVALCMLGVAVGVGLIYFGSSKLGIGVLFISGITLIVSITLDSLWSYIPWIGLAVISISVGLLIWRWMISEKAVDEIVKTAEITKEELAPDKRRELFGYEQEPGKIRSLQSKTTEQLVKLRRDRIKKEPQGDSVIEA